MKHLSIYRPIVSLPRIMAKFNVLTRHTVRKWLNRVRQENFQRADVMKQVNQQLPPTLIEQMAQKADELAGQVKRLKKELELAELQVIYYTNIT